MWQRFASPLLLLLLLPLLGPLSLTAQAPSPTPPPPIATLHTTTRIVALDLAVTDGHGQPIQGLKASDFTLFEDGVPQTLATFTEHDDTGTPLPSPPPLPPNTFADHAPLTGSGPVTAIVFDELSFADAAYARYEVAAFMKTLKPGMPICIFRLDWNGLHLVQDFTTDPQVLREAVNSKRNQQPLRPAGWLNYSQIDLRELASYLSGFPGRKNLIWFTAGLFPGDPSPGATFIREPIDIDNILKGTVDVLTLSRVALYPIDARGLVVNPRRGFEILAEDTQLEDLAANTGGRAFYSTNGFKQAVAEVVATGSHFYTLSYVPTNNNWNGRFRKITIEANANVFPGLHKTRLQQVLDLSASKPTLEYRRGYYAWSNGPRAFVPSTTPGTRRLLPFTTTGNPNSPDAAAVRNLRQAMNLGAVPPFQILFHARITPSPVTQKLKRHAPRPPNNYLAADWLHHPFRDLQVHFSIAPGDIAFTPGKDGLYHDTLEFVAVVYGDDGVQVNSLIDRTPVDLGPNEYLQAMRGGLGFDQTIAMPTHGEFFLRLGVHDLNSGHIGALEVPAESIKLPPHTRTQPHSPAP